MYLPRIFSQRVAPVLVFADFRNSISEVCQAQVGEKRNRDVWGYFI